MTLTPEKLASVRAAAARAADGWSPTSSSFAALEHCAEASPVAVEEMARELLELRAERRRTYEAIIDRARTVRADMGLTAVEMDIERYVAGDFFPVDVTVAMAARADIAAWRDARAGFRALEAERDGMAKALELARARVAELEAEVVERSDAASDALLALRLHEATR